MSELIKYKDVEICQDEQIVLTDVNLTISSGEMVYLLGRVGSGKSSFMKTIYGELPIEGTEATALDYDLLQLRRRDIPYLRRKVGVVFQDFQFFSAVFLSGFEYCSDHAIQYFHYIHIVCKGDFTVNGNSFVQVS